MKLKCLLWVVGMGLSSLSYAGYFDTQGSENNSGNNANEAPLKSTAPVHTDTKNSFITRYQISS